MQVRSNRADLERLEGERAAHTVRPCDVIIEWGEWNMFVTPLTSARSLSRSSPALVQANAETPGRLPMTTSSPPVSLARPDTRSNQHARRRHAGAGREWRRRGGEVAEGQALVKQRVAPPAGAMGAMKLSTDRQGTQVLLSAK